MIIQKDLTPPKVSVIIPAYNREQYIAETVKSVLDQTYSNIEVVVVDDGSTDSTFEILEKYKGSIALLRHPGGVNKGQSAAINLGIGNSDGKYVAVLDSDDLFATDKIELQVDYLEKHPDIGLVYGNGEAINETGRYLYTIFAEGHKENNNPDILLLDCYLNVPSNSLVRREVFVKAGEFDESLRSSQDHDMAIRLAEVTSFAYLDKILWYYRRHSDTQSGQHGLRRWNLGFTILENAKKRYPYSRKTIRKRRAVLHFRCGQCFMEERKYFKAIFNFLIAGFLDPVRSVNVLLG